MGRPAGAGLAHPGDDRVHQSGRPPDADPDVTAYWHFGWNVADSRQSLETFRAQYLLVPFYTDDQGDFVGISSDTYPYPPGVPGRTKAQIAEAVAQNLKPRQVSGNGYIHGPDHAIIEFTGNAPERFDHVHMWQDDPLCASSGTRPIWRRRRGAVPRRPSPSRRKLQSGAGARSVLAVPGPARHLSLSHRRRQFRAVAMNWYMNQTGKPLAPTQGRLMDHVSLSVGDLDAWIAKLKAENVTFLRQAYKIGDTRAVMIEGPSHEAIELVEVK